MYVTMTWFWHTCVTMTRFWHICMLQWLGFDIHVCYNDSVLTCMLQCLGFDILVCYNDSVLTYMYVTMTRFWHTCMLQWLSFDIHVDSYNNFAQTSIKYILCFTWRKKGREKAKITINIFVNSITCFYCLNIILVW
jgi:hypothetical protein